MRTRGFITPGGVAIFCLLLMVQGCATTPLERKLEVIQNGMTKQQVIDILGEPVKRSNKQGAEYLRFQPPFKKINEKAKWYEEKEFDGFFVNGILIHFSENGFSEGWWTGGGNLENEVKKEESRQEYIANEAADEARRKIRKNELEKERAELKEKQEKEAAAKQVWDDMKRKSMDPRVSPEVRKTLAEKYAQHQREETFGSLGKNYLEFHGYRIYANSGVYDADANLVYSCTNYQCMYSWATNKLLEMIRNPNISQAERQALTLEHQQLVTEYQLKETERIQQENRSAQERLQQQQLEEARRLQAEDQNAQDVRTAKTLAWLYLQNNQFQMPKTTNCIRFGNNVNCTEN